ncbi:MAG: HAD family hydrolase, partial [Verrucomicrobia bacterium]|nr:HAD family hydrolase [Verrucomicrobiota bacterium]
MILPTTDETRVLLNEYVQNEYQRHHALMVATAMDGYAHLLGEDKHLWWITGFLHDIDFEKHPDTHPGESLHWFTEWGYPEDLI